MPTIGNVQLGKQGVTDNFIGTLKNFFKNYQNVKISVLKSGTRDRKELKEMAEEIVEKLGKNFTSKIVGFKILSIIWSTSSFCPVITIF